MNVPNKLNLKTFEYFAGPKAASALRLICDKGLCATAPDRPECWSVQEREERRARASELGPTQALHQAIIRSRCPGVPGGTIEDIESTLAAGADPNALPLVDWLRCVGEYEDILLLNINAGLRFTAAQATHLANRWSSPLNAAAPPDRLFNTLDEDTLQEDIERIMTRRALLAALAGCETKPRECRRI